MVGMGRNYINLPGDVTQSLDGSPAEFVLDIVAPYGVLTMRGRKSGGR